MIESDRKAALLWKDDGVAGYNELEFSVGVGSPAETPEDDKLSQGYFRNMWRVCWILFLMMKTLTSGLQSTW